jgi:hypothetical protein
LALDYFYDFWWLAGEFTECKCHQGAITRLRLTWDEQLLVTASDDGSVLVHDVRDKDAKAAARREQVGVKRLLVEIDNDILQSGLED